MKTKIEITERPDASTVFVQTPSTSFVADLIQAEQIRLQELYKLELKRFSESIWVTTKPNRKNNNMIIKNQANEVRSEIQVLKEYFGLKPEQKLQDFMAECKALTPEAKQELAIGAAKEFGYTVAEDSQRSQGGDSVRDGVGENSYGAEMKKTDLLRSFFSSLSCLVLWEQGWNMRSMRTTEGGSPFDQIGQNQQQTKMHR